VATPSRLLTVADVAGELNVHRTTVYAILRRRLLKRVKIGRATRISRTELDRYLNRNTR